MPTNHNNVLIAQAVITEKSTCFVTLRNNHTYPAVVLDGDLFEVQLTRGVKIYAFDEIKSITFGASTTALNENTDERKEKKMPNIYHYLQEVKIDDGVYYRRVITNRLDEEVKDNYNESWASRKISGDVLAISTGDMKFRLLEETLVRYDYPFRITAMDSEGLHMLEPSMVHEMIEKADFVFANASITFFFEMEMGLAAIGLTAKHTRKIAKRLQEVVRLSKVNWFNPAHEPCPWDIWVFPLPVGGHKVDYDGMNVIRQSMLIKMARAIETPNDRYATIRAIEKGKKTRWQIRVENAGYTMKGDIVSVPDNQIDHDLITFDENLKAELVTNGFTNITIWEHEPRHTAVWDYQSTINFGAALPETKEISDIQRIATTMRNSLESNEIPSWLLLGENAHNDDGTVNLDKLSESIMSNHVRWQAHGLDIRSAQNLTYMALNGVVKRMKHAKRKGSSVTGISGYVKRWVPMTNAVLGSVITFDAATKMAGFDFSDRNPNVVFWDDRVGLVIPTKRFLETFDYHGGHDQDDSMKAIWISLWASGDYSMHLGKTLPSDIILPDKREDAVDMLLLVRSPNGPGEFSIERFDALGMFDEDMIDPSQVVTVDMCNMPLPQDILLEDVVVKGMPTSTQYTGEIMTKANMMEMVLAQMDNPGVGAYCNAIMVYYYSMRRFPNVLLDVMETIVDAAQQGYDAESFKAITEETKSIWGQLVRACEDDPKVKVEKMLATLKMPHKVQQKVAGHIVNGRFTRVEVTYNRTVNAIQEMIDNKTMTWRWESPLVRRLAMRPMDQNYVAWASEFYYSNNNRLSSIDAEFEITADMHPFAKMHMQLAKQEAMHRVVQDMVDFFENLSEEDRYLHVVNLYKWIVLGGRQDDAKAKLGKRDRIIFQPNARGHKCVMDILIEGIKHYGLA